MLLLQKLEELKRAQEEELEDRLDAGVKRILAANRRLAEELRLHVTVRWCYICTRALWLCCAAQLIYCTAQRVEHDYSSVVPWVGYCAVQSGAV